MNDKNRAGIPAVGASSLLVIFAVLCLTVFALLSMSTVQAGERLSDKTAQAVSGYYRADCQAEEILARLRLGQVADQLSVAGDVYFYSCPISDTQSLEVEVRLDGAHYTILRWQAVSTADWQPDESLNVWGGDMFS